jgi:hypothetical protein
MTTTGFMTDMSVVNDQLYINNKRTINGVEHNYIERWDFSLYVDCANKYTFETATTAITGLDHLEGESVRVRADDYDAGAYTVTGGAITLTNQANVVQVGLSYLPRIRSMPVSTNVGSGPNSNRIKKLVRINLYAFDTQGIYIDGQPTPVRQFSDASDSPLDTAPLFKTGVIEDFYIASGWGRDVMPMISQPDPMPFTILNIEYEVESS